MVIELRHSVVDRA